METFGGNRRHDPALLQFGLLSQVLLLRSGDVELHDLLRTSSSLDFLNISVWNAIDIVKSSWLCISKPNCVLYLCGLILKLKEQEQLNF